MTKKLPRDPAAELEGMRESLANIEWRKQETREAVEQKISERRKAIDTRHAQARDEIETQLPLSRPGRPALFQRQQRITRRNQGPGRDREKEREGPDSEP